MRNYITVAWNKALIAYHASIRAGNYIIGVIISLVAYLSYMKSSRTRDVALYNPDSQTFEKQFAEDMKKHGFVVVWSKEGFSYKQEGDEDWTFISNEKLSFENEIHIHINKGRNIVAVKRDKTYEIRTHDENILPQFANAIRRKSIILDGLYNLDKNVKKFKKLLDKEEKEQAEMKKEQAEMKKENAEVKKENAEMKKEQAEMKERMERLERLLSQNNGRSNSFAEMVDKSSNERVQERQIE